MATGERCARDALPARALPSPEALTTGAKAGGPRRRPAKKHRLCHAFDDLLVSCGARRCGKNCARFPMPPAIAARHPCAPSVICATSVAMQVLQNVSTALSVCRRRRRMGLGDAAFPVDLWAGARVCRRRDAPQRGLHRSKDAGVRPGFADVPRAIDEGKRRRGLRARSHVGRSQYLGSPTRADPHHPERSREVESPHDQFLA
jgi:hypothetical protein